MLVLAGAAAMTFTGAQAQPTGTQPTHYIMPKIKVTNLQRSIDFYTKVIGMRDMQHYKTPTMEEAFLSYEGSDYEAAIVLIYDTKHSGPYVPGDAFGPIAFITPDLQGTADRLKAAGYPLGKIGEVKSQFSYAKTVSHAAGKDPDGYPIEIVQFNY
jgi:lactoylglutathione lyase